MNYKIAIPTHRRSSTLRGLTLSLMDSIPPSDIFLFISDEEDFKTYEKDYGEYNLILCNTKSVKEKFNFVQQYFVNGEWVIVLEDDIKEIQDLGNRSTKDLIEYMISFTESKRSKCFGIYPSSNKFFMTDSVEVGLTFLVAHLYGFIAESNPELNCKEEVKIDYERSVLFWSELSPIVRFNHVSCKTNNYTNKGGIQEVKDTRAELERVSCDNLVKRYPSIFSINDKRKSKYTELKMNKNSVKVKVK